MAQHLFTFLKETSKHSLPFGVGPDEEHHMGCRASKVSSGAGKPHWLQQEKESQTWDSPKNVCLLEAVWMKWVGGKPSTFHKDKAVDSLLWSHTFQDC